MSVSNQQNRNVPEIINQTTKIIEGLHPSLKESVQLACGLAKTTQVLNFKRIKFKELENVRSINAYLILLAPSGAGKDKSLKDLDKYVFNKILSSIEDAYQKIYEDEKQKIKEKYASDLKARNKELKALRKITIQTNNATPEGIFLDAHVLSKQNVGSIFIRISELAYMLAGPEGKKFLKCIFSCYDGDFDAKSIKSADKVDNITDIPISFLGLSDPSEMASNLNNTIRPMLEMGLARRAFFAFQPFCTIAQVNPSEQRQKLQLIYQEAKELSDRYFEIFEKIEDNSVFNFREDTLDQVIYPYKNELALKANAEANSILQKEILSRELKVLNIACLYACISHPDDKQIYIEDALMAKDTVEFLSSDITSFLNYKPLKDDEYGKMYSILYCNKGKRFKKTEFIHKYYKEIGVGRKKLRDNFINFMAMVSELAHLDGCEVYEDYTPYRNTIEIWLEDKKAEVTAVQNNFSSEMVQSEEQEEQNQQFSEAKELSPSFDL